MISTIIWTLFFIVWATVIWLLLIWPMLQRRPALASVFQLMDKYDAGNFAKLRVLLSGLKRKLFARLIWLSGAMISLHDLVLPHIGVFEPLLPEKFRVYLLPIMTIMGILFEVLSRISPQPVDEVNPEVISDSAGIEPKEVAIETADDPIVAAFSPEQLVWAFSRQPTDI